MSKKTTRALISLVIVGGALGILLVTTASKDAAYFKQVDEVMVDPAAWYGKGMNLHGFVENSQVNPSTLDYRFSVKNGDKVVLATYRGLVPDTFKDGAEVILKGRLTKDGFHVEKDGIVAKCPSKYEAGKTPGSGSGSE